MNELQSRLLEIMKWFHNFCVDNNLKYYMLGGTMLGAIRHKGFIPWDDDMDVGMPREDYMRFIELTKNLKHDIFFVESIYSCSDTFSYPACKVYDKNSTLIEHTRRPIIRGIFLDVFPLDSVEYNYKKINKVILRHKILLSQRVAFRTGRNFLKNVSVFISRLLPYSDKLIVKKLINLDTKIISLKTSKSNYVANFYGAWGMKEVMPLRVFGEPTLYSFEDSVFFGPECSHDYLKHIYGQYNVLPPLEKRKTHHDFMYLNLQLPFKSFTMQKLH